MSPSVLKIPPLLAGLGLELSGSAVGREAHLPLEISPKTFSACNPATKVVTEIVAMPLIASQLAPQSPNQILDMRRFIASASSAVLPLPPIQIVASADRFIPQLRKKGAPIPTKQAKKSHKRQGPPKEKPKPNPDILSPAEAAAFLSKAEGTLTNWRSLRKGPPWRKYEGGIVYSRATLDRWSQNREVNPKHEHIRPRKVL